MENKSKENEIILELCKFKDYNPSILQEGFENKPDLPYILGQLIFNRMGGVAYHVLKESGLLNCPNREFRNSLQIIQDSYYTKTNSFCSVLDDLSVIFKKSDFRYAFLKGSYLASLYPKGMRVSNDFDILIDQSDIPKVTEILNGNGYIQGKIGNGEIVPASRKDIIFSRMNTGETIPFLKQIDLPEMKFAEIDVNFSLDYKAKQETDYVKKMLINSQALIKTTQGQLYTLCLEDFIIQLCLHLYKEASIMAWVNMSRDLSIYKFCDIYFLLHEYLDEVLMKKLIISILSNGVPNECYYALIYTKLLFKIDNPWLNQILREIKPEETDYIRKIYDPENKTVYSHDMYLVDWLFCGTRRSQLKECNENITSNVISKGVTV